MVNLKSEYPSALFNERIKFSVSPLNNTGLSTKKYSIILESPNCSSSTTGSSSSAGTFSSSVGVCSSTVGTCSSVVSSSVCVSSTTGSSCVISSSARTVYILDNVDTDKTKLNTKAKIGFIFLCIFYPSPQ